MILNKFRVLINLQLPAQKLKIRMYYYVYKLSMIYNNIKINKQELYIKYGC